MNKNRYIRSFAPLCVLPLGLGLHAAEEAARESAAVQKMDALVVVGEKTERSLKDTVSSVSVISAETIESMQHQTLTDAVSDVVNVVSLSGAVPDIRGVSGNGGAGGFNSITGGANARVSILVDGVAEPFVADMTGDSGLWDIEQIEVYRGPQSTSNGSNSIAGSIYIKTPDPTFHWEGAGRVGYRNQDGYLDTSMLVSGPIIEDKLAFRLSAQRVDAETITDEAGFSSNAPTYDLNELSTERYRAKFLWRLSDDTDVLVSHSAATEQGDAGRRYYDVADPWAFVRTFYRNIKTETDTTSIKLDHRINKNLSTDVLFAYMDYQWGFDSYEQAPTAPQYLTFDQSSITLDAKLNFESDDSGLKGFVGFAHFDRDQDILSTGGTVYDGDDDSDSNAVYGEVDYRLTDSWSVIAGARLHRQTQLRHFNIGAIQATLDKSRTILLPKLIFQYDLSDRNRLFFGARRGYNAGGGALDFSGGQYYFYDDETVNTYEVGLRSTLSDHAHLVTTLFFNEYDGYQAQNSARRIVNMDKVETYGAEFELDIRPTDKLEVTAGLGLLQTKIKDAGATLASATGNELNSAPELTASLGGKYWVNDHLNVGATVKYVGEYFGDVSNTSEGIAGDYTVLRLNSNYYTGDWVISAFVNNALDAKEFLTRGPASGSSPNGYVAVVEPRHVGISATYSF